MWITRVSINHPVFATMVMVASLVLGLFSYQRLRIEQMPDVTFPVVFVSVQYPGASPEAVENDLTKPIENVANTINGVKLIRSNSYEGRSDTVIEFRLDANIDKGVQDVRDKIAQIRPGFPKDAKDPLIGRADTDNTQPVVSLAVKSESLSLRELTTLTDQIIVKRFQNIVGVGQVQVSGGVGRQIIISLKPAQMQAQNIGVNQVIAAIQNANQDMPAGNIISNTKEQLLRLEGKIKDPKGFGRIIVTNRNSGPVYLEQVADIIDGQEEQNSISRVNGKPALNINVLKVQDANIVEVGEGIKKAAAELNKTLPAAVELKVLRANVDWIKRSVDGVKETIIEGALLTVFIVFLFLHSWRSTIITGLTLPIAVISAFIALNVFGFTLNFMTLMALSLCIGLLIDDAIVVRENIVRHLAMGKDHDTAAREGTDEIGLAVMATTFAIVAVFVPVAFMSGIIGRFFLQFGITVTVAVLVSLFVSFTLDPMLSSKWHDPVENRFQRLPWLGTIMQRIESGVEWLHHIYGRLLARALAWRKTTLTIASLTFIASLFLVPLIGTEFVPETDNGETSFKLTTPVGSGLAYTDAKTKQVEAVLRNEFPEIDVISADVGTGEGRNISRVDVKLVDKRKHPRRSQKNFEAAVRARLKAIPGIELSVGYNTPIFVNLLGPAPEKLADLTRDTMEKIGQIKGITDLESSLKAQTPAITMRVNNELASDLGLSVAQIGAAVRPFIAGDVVSRWLAPDGQNYDVNVQLPKSGRQKSADIGDLYISSNRVNPEGTPRMVPLRQVVELVPSSSPQVIKRQDLQRRVGIYANVEGRPAGDVGTEVQDLVKKIQLPTGYRFDIRGETQQMQETFSSALAALGMAVIFIYLILASQFGSFLQPIAIMASLPLSLIGVFLALLMTGSTLNIFSIIGFIMLMGLVTKNAILLVDFTNQAQREGKSQYDAIMTAGQVRLRPIMMTTMAMIFGMLPMAIGLSEGAELQTSMGRAVIGGVITSTLLTLVVVPVVYSYLDSWGRRISARLGRKKAAQAVSQA
ncbi:MAG: efflux RND transporter permease subunit [Burkholderiales bacterium]